MSILGKVKELKDEIVKTVDESNLKENVECATMIIKDTVEKGKKEIESKIEDSKRKIEEEKKRLAALGINKEQEVLNNFDQSKEVLDIEKAFEFSNTFNEKMCSISSAMKDKKLTFGEKLNNHSSEEDIENVEDIEKERILVSYNGSKKSTIILSDKFFCLMLNHPIEDSIYSIHIPTEKIQSISVIKEDDKNLITINNVQVGIINDKVSSLLEKYFKKITNKEYFISINEVIEEVNNTRFVESQAVVRIIEDIINNNYKN